MYSKCVLTGGWLLCISCELRSVANREAQRTFPLISHRWKVTIRSTSIPILHIFRFMFSFFNLLLLSATWEYISIIRSTFLHPSIHYCCESVVCAQFGLWILYAVDRTSVCGLNHGHIIFLYFISRFVEKALSAKPSVFINSQPNGKGWTGAATEEKKKKKKKKSPHDDDTFLFVSAKQAESASVSTAHNTCSTNL